MCLEMRDCAFNWTLPFEAKIAVARLYRQPRNLSRLHPRPVHIELLVAKSISPADRPPDQFRTHNLAVEPVRTVPIGDMNDTMIEFDAWHVLDPEVLIMAP